jgi:RNA polymerase sigma factor (sigma-70 family)
MEETIHINRRLIEKCLGGDMKAQFQLYKQYSQAMYNIALRFLNNKMDAEDILQESFVTAFSRLDELHNKDAFGSWLKRIVINNCISLQRKRKMRFEEIDEYQHGQEDAGEEGLAQLDPALVHQAIKELPAKGRAVLVLRALEGYSHKEIAEALGVTVSTSKTQYSRALGLLNGKLKGKIHVEEA